MNSSFACRFHYFAPASCGLIISGRILGGKLRLLDVGSTVIFLIIFLGFGSPTASFHSSKREQHVIENFTSYEWRLLAWADSQLACALQIDHEGLPNLREISSICQPEVTQRWLDYPVCDAATHGATLRTAPDFIFTSFGLCLPNAKSWSSYPKPQPWFP